MKNFLKVLSLILAMLLFVTCFVACGGEKETDPEETETETEAPKETEKLDEFGRPWIEDSVPTDANYSGAEKNTITFFVRSGSQARQYELDVDEPLREELLLGFPLRLLCSEDCEGLCPKCGRPKREGDCGCVLKEIDPRLAVLKNFFDKDQDEK